METNIKNGTKVTVLGAGNVGATIAYTLSVAGTCSEIVLVDIKKDKAEGEAMDITQGLAFCPSVSVRNGEYSDTKDSDIVIVTLGIARRPGQTRLDLAQTNVNIVKSVMPEVAALSPNAVYLVVSNPVDILTYAIIKSTNLSPKQVIGSGTMLDTSRLRSIVASKTGLSIENIHAYVYGEHGDTAFVPWSLTSVGGIGIKKYCEGGTSFAQCDFDEIENEVRTAGAEVIKRKGATFFAIALSVRKICDVILRNAHAVLTVSGFANGRYGIEDDVCLSLPFVIGGSGIMGELTPALTAPEQEQLKASAEALRDVIKSLDI